MRIRFLTTEDGDEYQRLLTEGVNAHPECFRITEKDILASPFNPEDPDGFTLGAFSDSDRLVGVVSLRRDSNEKMRHKALLYRMHVTDEAAGQGFGRRLMEEALSRARKMEGLEQVNLTVIASNLRARNLYASLEFIPFSLEKNAVKNGERYLDEEQMVFRLR